MADVGERRPPKKAAATKISEEKLDARERLNLVEPMGFEPTTFPVSPGRAHQPLNHPAIFPGFDLALAEHRFTARLELLRMDELPGSAVPQGFRVVGVVVDEAFGHVLRLTNVETAGGFALEDV
jgi:hypothetical protein